MIKTGVLMNKYRISGILEPFILYFIFYFPVFISYGENTDIYSSNIILLTYTVLSILQTAFIIYFMRLKKTGISMSGIKPFSIKIIPYSVLYIIPLFIIVISVNLIMDQFIGSDTDSFNKTGSYLLKALAVSFVTGYREEIFFRSYLISSFENNYGKITAVSASSLLFAVSHSSGGTRAVLTALSAAVFLAYVFIKHRNIHINAVTHSLYNFLILISVF